MRAGDLYFYIKYGTTSFLRRRTTKNGVAVFIQLGGIGDLVLSLFAMSKIKEVYSTNYLICKDTCYELAKSLHIWDDVIPVSMIAYKKNMRYRKEINKKFKIMQVEDLYNMVYSRNLYTELAVMQIQAVKKYGFKGEDSQSGLHTRISDKLYCNTFEINEKIMEIEKYTQYANWILDKKYANQIYCINRLTSFQVQEVEGYYVVMPGGSYSEKRWESWKFGRVIDYIWHSYKLMAVLLGDAAERDIGNEITNQIKGEGIVNYIGKTTLAEMTDVIANAHFLIGNDSAGVHLAAATRTKSYAIAGCWDMSRFLPYVSIKNMNEYRPCVIRASVECSNCAYRGNIGSDCGVVATQQGCGKNHACLSKITVGEVLKQIVKGLTNSNIAREE